jgi:hypothetical protein
MTSYANIPSLERITFSTGQRLTATDLSELQRAHRELRWLHNRSLHSWGIGLGLAVQGERGDSAVTIGPGYAVDCLGREIILTEPQTKTVPAVAGGSEGEDYYLIAAYQDDEDQAVAERRPGVCLPEGAVRLSEGPLIDWRRPNKWVEGKELILAQAWVQNCQLTQSLSLAPRRSARPTHQPYIAAGQTERGNTPWMAWLMEEEDQMVGVYTEVDTSAACFQTTPHYIAHVAGARFIFDAVGAELTVLGFTGIADATPMGFTLQVLLPSLGGGAYNPDRLCDRERGPDIVRNQLNWYVVWLGIEG